MFACEAEAVAQGLPADLGKDIYLGVLDDISQGWSKKEFNEWGKGLDKKYGFTSNSPLPSFYVKCCEIMGEYDSLQKSSMDT